MLRVLHVIATLDRAGAEKQLARLCLGLDRRRFAPAVCCLTRGGPWETELRGADVPVWVLGKRPGLDLAALFRLRRLMRQCRPDIVHTWLFTANSFGRTAAVLARVPVIIGAERAADVWKGPLHRFIDRALTRCSRAVVANCEAVRRFCIETSGLPAAKIEVIANGLDLAGFDAAAARATDLAAPAGRLVVGAVARLEKQKDLPTLLAAMAHLNRERNDAALWVVGDGPDLPALRDRAAELGLDPDTVFLGRRDDVPALLRQIDVFVLPSLWEGLPNAVMEAMAAARPVVATAVDGTAELVADGVTGRLVPPGDAAALAAAIAALLDDPDRRRRFGAAGRERIAREFSEGKMIDAVQRLYERLAGIDSRGAAR